MDEKNMSGVASALADGGDADVTGAETSVVQAITSADVIKAAAILGKYKDGKKALEARLKEDEKWYKIRHWEAVRGKTDENGNIISTVQPTSAWLFNTLANKHADAMDNYPEPVVLPREESDEDSAKTLQEILPVIRERCGYEQVYSDNWWEKLKHGTGVYGVFWDPTLENGLGDISITRIDLLNIYWQPGIEDIQDSRNLFITSLVDDDILSQQYPEQTADGKLGDAIDKTQYQYDDQVDTTEQTLVVDWYYKRQVDGRTVLHYCKFAGDKVLFASENDPQYAGGWYEHGEYPVVFDTLYPEKGTPVGFGYVSVCKDPQLYIDRLGGCILENAIVCSKPRYFTQSGSGLNEKEFLDVNNALVHIEGPIDDNRCKPITVPQLSGNIISVWQEKIDELKETSSNCDFSAGGTASGVTAASAIAALQEAGNKTSRDVIAASYRSDAKVTTLSIEDMRQFYTEQRCFRITGKADDSGAPAGSQYVTFDNSAIQPQTTVTPDGQELIRKPIFDIKIKAQKKNPYNQLSQNELAKELFQLGVFDPQRATEAMMLLDMMDFEGIDKVRDKVSQGQTLYNLLQTAIQQRDEAAAAAGMMMDPTGGAAQQQSGQPAAAGGGQTQGSRAVQAQTANNKSYAQKIAERTNASASPGGAG